MNADTVAGICESQLKDLGLNNFCYQYRDDPKDVDLSDMLPWETFQKKYAPSK